MIFWSITGDTTLHQVSYFVPILFCKNSNYNMNPKQKSEKKFIVGSPRSGKFTFLWSQEIEDYGYQISVDSVLILLNKFNKSILCKPLTSISFHSTSSINLVMNLHEFNTVYHIPLKELFIVKKNNQSFFTDTPIV